MARETSSTSDPKAVERVTKERSKRQEQDYIDSHTPEAPITKETTGRLWGKVKSHGESARIVVGLMAFSTTFALISTEIEALTGTKPVTNGVRIILGGGVATIILLLVSEAGDGGAQLAEGLALITLVATTLVKGKPVWDWLNKTVGTQPTSPTGTATNPLGGPANVVPGLSQVGPPNPNVGQGLPTPGHPTVPTGGRQ